MIFIQVSYLDIIHSLLNNQSIFVGGQVRFHIEQWPEITSDPYVLQCVKNCHLELECEPSSSFNRHTNAQNFSFSEQQSIDNELNEFLSKQIIEFSHHESGEIISRIFILPKKEQGKNRVIFNLKNSMNRWSTGNLKWTPWKRPSNYLNHIVI